MCVFVAVNTLQVQNVLSPQFHHNSLDLLISANPDGELLRVKTVEFSAGGKTRYDFDWTWSLATVFTIVAIIGIYVTMYV